MSTDTAAPPVGWLDQFVADNKAQGLRGDLKEVGTVHLIGALQQSGRPQAFRGEPMGAEL